MFFRHVIWSIFWAIIIACLYLAPGKDMPKIEFWDFIQFDKLGHLAVFCLLTLFLKIGFNRQRAFQQLQLRSTLWALTFAIPYGGILEFIQGTISHDRQSDIFDFGANVVGCILGIVIYRLIYRRL